MSRADCDRWNRKYAPGNPNPDFEPDPLLARHTALLGGGGMALDVACGVGHNALFLAQLGFEVIALDGSLTALRYCQTVVAQRRARVHPVVADLDRFVLRPDAFDLVVVFRFLSRRLIPDLKQTLRPGGLMFYQTFNANRRRHAPAMNRDYLLERGELAELFRDFETIETNDTPELTDELSYWIGRRG